jgi:predicted amidohydrolase
MASLTVALLQLRSAGLDVELALDRGESACREAGRLGADVALFPEMWQVGCTSCPGDEGGRRAWCALATETDGPFVSRFQALAKELGMAIVITYLQRAQGAPRNAASVIDRHGRIVFTYAKVHTCDFGMEAAVAPGDGFLIGDLELEQGSVRVGVMICYDREFPEAARVLMLAGAEVILTPNACALTDDRVGQFRARAFENMVGVAMANYAAAQQPVCSPNDCNGRSVAYSGICFEPDGSARDQTLVEAGTEEGIYLATFNLDELRAWRQQETWGDAYRKPHTYHALVADTPAPVFTRGDSRRTPRSRS